jgi:hypothetical protein
MRRSHTRGTLLSRLERLEVRTVSSHRVKVRFGKLRQLPEDYKGERHVIVAKQLPSRNGQEWVEFEEVPGPDPNPPQKPQRGVPTRIDVLLVAPPRTDDAQLSG